MDKAKEYFEELKSKGADALKEYMPGGVEEFFSHLFKKDAAPAGKPDVTTTTTTTTV
jgi:hypothetical protein